MVRALGLVALHHGEPAAQRQERGPDRPLKEWNVTLTLPKTLTIVEVTKCRTDLLAALEAGGDLELDARSVEEVDVAGLQLLEATHKSAVARGLALHFTPGGRGAIDATAAAVGLRLSQDSSTWREAHHG